MNHYRTDNSNINGQKLWLIFIVVFSSFLYLVISEFNLLIIAIIACVNIAFVLLLIIQYKFRAFELYFNENGIEEVYTYSKVRNCYSYLELKQVHYTDTYGSSATNTFLLQKDMEQRLIKVDTVGYGEKYVAFIKWLKTKNSDFETYIYPKGSTLHMRLRQELLGKEF